MGLSKLDLSKTIMYKFWYNYVKPKYSENSKLYYMDTESFIVHVKTEDIYKDIWYKIWHLIYDIKFWIK